MFFETESRLELLRAVSDYALKSVKMADKTAPMAVGIRMERILC